MPPSNHRKNQAQRMPPVHESLHPRQTRRRLHGQQRRHLPSLGKKRRRPSLTDSWHGVADWLCDYSFAADQRLHCYTFELGGGFADYLGIFAFGCLL